MTKVQKTQESSPTCIRQTDGSPLSDESMHNADQHEMSLQQQGAVADLADTLATHASAGRPHPVAVHRLLLSDVAPYMLYNSAVQLNVSYDAVAGSPAST